ncbi:MAG: FAD-dependent oxidoreductase [Anaerolineae bacterium]|nr:FAD-dependent oxidoreductase [Anaerolineae bacterium]
MEFDQIQSDRTDVIIIGAGVAGLTAGLHLAERGLSPLILEADPAFVGGRLAGGERVKLGDWEFRAEHGVHGVWSSYRNLQAMLARHHIRPTFIPSNEETWIYKRGKRVRRAKVGSALRRSWLPAPLHYLNLFIRPSFLRMLDIRDLLALPIVWGGLVWGLGIDPMAEDQALEGMYLDSLVKYWPPAVRAFFVGLARNGLSASPEEIPLSGFISFLRFYSLLRRDAWAFTYMPDDGGTSVCEPLAGRVRELGGRIVLDTPVKGIEKLAEEGFRITYMKQGRAHTIRCSQLVVAADVTNAEKLLAASPSLTHDKPFYWPRGMETAVVRVWFNKQPKPGAESGILTGDFALHNFFWLDKLYGDYRQWSRQTGGSAVEAHVYNPGELETKSDEELLVRAVADLRSAFPELRGARIHQTITRNPVRHTMIEVGPRGRHLTVRSPWEGLFFCGDWVNDPAPAFFIERACLTGMLAANAVLEARRLEPWKTLPYPQPEAFAGWIEKLMMRGRKKRVERRK